jgi:predicted  nucleic acid-binding Zn-ribbon protein
MPITFTFQTRLPTPTTADALQARIRELYLIKDQLDGEIETLMGCRVEFDTGTPYHCVRCDHKWLSKLPHKPRMCPACKVKRFEHPPLWSYADRMKKRPQLKEREVESAAPLPHSVITRDLPPLIPPRVEDITLAPPPVLEPIRTPTLTLRERLALLNARPQPAAGSESDVPCRETQQTGQSELLSNGAAADGAHLAVNESATEDELVEAINGDQDAT